MDGAGLGLKLGLNSRNLICLENLLEIRSLLLSFHEGEGICYKSEFQFQKRWKIEDGMMFWLPSIM